MPVFLPARGLFYLMGRGCGPGDCLVRTVHPMPFLLPRFLFLGLEHFVGQGFGVLQGGQAAAQSPEPAGLGQSLDVKPGDLPPFPHSSPLSFVGADQGEMAQHDLHLFFRGRFWGKGAGLKVLGDFGKDPGTSVTAPGYRHQIAAGLAVHLSCILGAHHVPVADDRDGHGLFHLLDNIPIRPRLVQLGFGAAVDGDGRGSLFLAELGQLRGVGVLGIVTFAHLHGNGDVHCLHAGPDNLGGFFGCGHQPAPCTGRHHFVHRAAHIDVDEGGVVLGGDFGRLGKEGGVVSE